MNLLKVGSVVTVLFLILRAFNVVHWSWLWLTVPLWGPGALILNLMFNLWWLRISGVDLQVVRTQIAQRRAENISKLKSK